MEIIEEKNPRWFVYNSYTPAGRPELENEVMRYAVTNYMGALIAESEFDNVVDDLLAYGVKIRAVNKRLQPVNVSVVKNPLVRDRANIFIGAQSLSLMKVRAVVD